MRWKREHHRGRCWGFGRKLGHILPQRRKRLLRLRQASISGELLFKGRDSLHRWIVDIRSRFRQQTLFSSACWSLLARIGRGLTTSTKAGPITSAASSLISAYCDSDLRLAYIEARELIETSLSTSSLTSFEGAWSLHISFVLCLILAEFLDIRQRRKAQRPK